MVVKEKTINFTASEHVFFKHPLFPRVQKRNRGFAGNRAIFGSTLACEEARGAGRNRSPAKKVVEDASENTVFAVGCNLPYPTSFCAYPEK